MTLAKQALLPLIVLLTPLNVRSETTILETTEPDLILFGFIFPRIKRKLDSSGLEIFLLN